MPPAERTSACSRRSDTFSGGCVYSDGVFAHFTYRYGLLEAGHLGRNVYLTATSMGLGACAIGAFADDQVNAMLGADGNEEAAVYMLAVGKV